ncbi:MAG: transposase [Ruminococcus sp.]|nr:transposase [Ruminococcus sp.]
MNFKTRKPNRLKNYDYSQNGVYFITVCVKNRNPILSYIPVGANCVRLSKIGKVVEEEINNISKIYANVTVENYVIMPNHIHLLVFIDRFSGRTQFAPTISRIIKQFKGVITKRLGKSIWQKGFYDHIIRDEYDFQIRWQYIEDNPYRWCEDYMFNKNT